MQALLPLRTRVGISLLALVILVFSLGLTATTAPVHADAHWNLVWSDEFNQTSLDTSHWSLMTGPSFYTPRTLETYTAANAQMGAGALGLHSTGSNGTYTSAGVSSRGKFAFQYGRVEWRVNLPQGQGLWPALWLMPADGSSTYEIDALEAFGQDPATVLMTNHWTNDAGKHAGATTSYTGADLSQGYHTIAVTWLPDEIYWQVDGVIRKETTAHIPNVPMYVMMNTAIGGWAGNAAATLDSTFSIDSMRVYRQTATTATSANSLLTSHLSVAPGKANLTTLGTLDWASWGATSLTDRNTRQNGGKQISDYGAIGSWRFQYSGGSGSTLSWSDGAAPRSGTNPGRGIATCGTGNGFVLTFPADQQTSVVHLYVNVWQAQGRLEAFLNDRSSAPLLDTNLTQTSGGLAGVYTITYRAPAPGDTLFVRWTVQTDSPNACVVLQAATLARTATTHAPRRKP